MPGLFVVLWSTGFIGAKLGLPYAEPLTFLGLRFIVVAALLLVLALAMRAPWPSSLAETGHIAVVGVLLLALLGFFIRALWSRRAELRTRVPEILAYMGLAGGLFLLLSWVG